MGGNIRSAVTFQPYRSKMFFAFALALVSLASTAQSLRANVWSSEGKAESNSHFAESRQTSMEINMGPECKTW